MSLSSAFVHTRRGLYCKIARRYSRAAAGRSCVSKVKHLCGLAYRLYNIYSGLIMSWSALAFLYICKVMSSKHTSHDETVKGESRANSTQNVERTQKDGSRGQIEKRKRNVEDSHLISFLAFAFSISKKAVCSICFGSVEYCVFYFRLRFLLLYQFSRSFSF